MKVNDENSRIRIQVPSPDPDPLVRGMDPRIRIHPKMSWIRKTDFFTFRVVMEKLWFGDWFILMQLCKNMNQAVFHDLVIDLRDR